VSLLARPRRSAVIRTELDPEGIRERLLALATQGAPQGFFAGHLPFAYFLGGHVTGAQFALDYYFGSRRLHIQKYTIRGEMRESPEGRYLHLVCQAGAPWIKPWMLVLLAAFTALAIGSGRFRATLAAAAIALVGLGVAGLALVNLVYTPTAVRNRVAHRIALAVRGEVRRGA
jgi:hypothetical protein